MIRGVLLAAASILIWSVTFVNTKALLVDFSALEIQVLRFTMAFLALLPLARGTARKSRPTRHDEPLFVAMGFTGVAAYQLPENCAIHYTNASNVAILVSLCPVVTELMQRLLGGRRPPPSFYAGFLLAITGVVLVSVNGVRTFHLNPLGDLMAVAAMLNWGVYSILVGRCTARGFSQVVVIRHTFFWALVLTLPLVLFGLTQTGRAVLNGSFAVTGHTARFASWANWFNLSFLGLLASAACFVMWNKACAALGVVRCTVGLYLIPVFTVVVAWLFLDERLSACSVTGMVLTLAGVALSGRVRS